MSDNPVIVNHFHDEQKAAASNIFAIFTNKEAEMKYALLMAYCQSGKSGAFHYLIRLMLQDGIITHVYILCGSHETILRDQAKDDAKKFNPDYYKDDNTGAIQIYFRQDFKKATMNVVNALIVVDESHLDAMKGSMLDNFLYRHGGISMDGNPVPLKEKNTFILSVDATPYDELSNLAHEGCFPKYVEELVPGSAYYGIAKYFFNGGMQETFSITGQPVRFAKVLKTYPKKYALLRLTNMGKTSKEDEEKVMDICQKIGVPVCYYLDGKKDIAVTQKEKIKLRLKFSLEDEPEKTTVVIFRGTLRAGKVVPKQHIGFVWEGSTNGKTDSLVQGLPGRMCGYDFNKDGSKPMLFVPPSSLKENEKKVIKASEWLRAINGRQILPQKATNLQKVRLANVAADGLHMLPPISVNVGPASGIWDGGHQIGKAEITSRARNKLLDGCIIRSCPFFNDEQKDEIMEILKTYEPATRNGMEQPRWYTDILNSNGNTVSEHVWNGPSHPLMTVFYVKPPASLPAGVTLPAGANPSVVHVIFYTKAAHKIGMEQINLESRIAPPNGKSHFSFRNSSISEPAVAGGIAAMKADNIKNPESLRAYLDEYMTQWKTSPNIMYSRSIVCNKDAFRFSLKTFPDGIKDVNSICSLLGTKFGVKMSVKQKKGRKMDGFFNLAEISW